MKPPTLYDVFQGLYSSLVEGNDLVAEGFITHRSWREGMISDVKVGLVHLELERSTTAFYCLGLLGHAVLTGVLLEELDRAHKTYEQFSHLEGLNPLCGRAAVVCGTLLSHAGVK